MHPKDQHLTIHLLGSFSVTVDGRVVDDAAWQRRHARQLVKLLALNPRHRLQREVLAEQLWPESAPASASNNLNKMLFMARRALEPTLENGADSQYLHRVGDIIELSCESGLSVDVEVFEEKAALAISQDRFDQLSQCAELYTGDLLADEPYDDAFIHRREALSRLYQQVLLKLSEIAQRDGHIGKSVDALLELLRCEPLNEMYHRQLMQVYADSNQRGKMLQQFDSCSALLLEELGQEPEAETRMLKDTLVNIAATPKPVEPVHTTAINAEEATADALAVLPFDNTSDLGEFDYLCDGITDNLIVSLSRLPAKRVLARSTVLRYCDKPFDPFKIRRELNVGEAITGRITWVENRIHVWIEVLDTSDGVLQWAQHYDQDMQDIVALQKQIGEEVNAWFLSALNMPHSPGVPELHTVNADAYHAYLKGRYHWNKRNGDALSAARQYFQTAIDLDPVYALAYAGLADTYNVMSLFTAAAPHDTMPKAKAAAKHALAIDSQLCEAHTSLAYCLASYDWLWHESESAFKRALAINPHYATARQWYHKLLVACGRFDEARAQIAQAKTLDPLSVMISTEEGWGMYYSHQYEKAVLHLQKVLADDPQFVLARCLLGLSQVQLSLYGSAIENLRSAEFVHKPFTLQAGAIGYAYAMDGQVDQAQSVLQTLSGMDCGSGGVAYAKAQVYCGLGDVEAALENLETAFAARSDRLIFLHVEPIFDSLREQPRMRAMARQLEHLPVPA